MLGCVLIAGMTAACSSSQPQLQPQSQAQSSVSLPPPPSPPPAPTPPPTPSQAPTPTATPATIAEPAVTIADLRQRPLQLPAVAAGTACPVSPQEPVTPNPAGPGPPEFAFGSGPTYLNGHNNWYAEPVSQGANLLFDTSGSGPILVRVSSLDGGGRLTLKEDDIPNREYWRLSGTETSDGLEIQVPPLPGTTHWPVWTGILLADSPGCYGIQVDASGFTATIVFTVGIGPGPG